MIESNSTTKIPVIFTLNCIATVNRTYVTLGELLYEFTWRLGSSVVETEQNRNGFSTLTIPLAAPFQVNYTCSAYVREANGRLPQSTAANYYKFIDNPGIRNTGRTFVSITYYSQI